jgi:hypothetical protein
MFFVFEAISASFFDGGFTFAEDGKGAHLVRGIGFADFAHGKPDVNEHPVAGPDGFILEETEVDFAAHTDNFDNGLIAAVGVERDDPTGDCQTHARFLLANGL